MLESTPHVSLFLPLCPHTATSQYAQGPPVQLSLHSLSHAAQAAKVREASSVRIVSATSELSDSDVLPILGLLGNKFKLAQDGNRSHVLVHTGGRAP